jgi:glyoxylase-like metal-dependent hydrolase (beta-lactamase superfamily II)
MKRIKKSLFWGMIIFAGLVIIAALSFYIKFQRATRTMTPAETHAINDSVWCIKDKFVNVYIFKGKNSYLMVDGGFSKRNFKKELKKTGIAPEQITTILLTHSDGDHIGALGLFSLASIYMHKAEEQMINGTTGKTKYFKTKWKYGPYKLLNDYDTLTIDGLTVKLIHTPGHTPGSSCFIIGGDYLLTVDNLVVKEGKYSHFVEMFNMNTAEQTESIKHLPDPGFFKYILTAHHGIVKMNLLAIKSDPSEDLSK